jgi:hypothetical protein
MNPAAKNLVLDRLDIVRTTLAKTQRDQLEEGRNVSAAESGHALKDVRAAIEAIRNADRDLTLPVYKHVRSPDELSEEEARALFDNDPVAGTEFGEMATLFLQMHGLVQDLLDKAGLCAALGSPPPEDVRILQARSQALVDNTRNFTRPIRT